jgi:hypothetical protein
VKRRSFLIRQHRYQTSVSGSLLSCSVGMPGKLVSGACSATFWVRASPRQTKVTVTSAVLSFDGSISGVPTRLASLQNSSRARRSPEASRRFRATMRGLVSTGRMIPSAAVGIAVGSCVRKQVLQVSNAAAARARLVGRTRRFIGTLSMVLQAHHAHHALNLSDTSGVGRVPLPCQRKCRKSAKASLAQHSPSADFAE